MGWRVRATREGGLAGREDECRAEGADHRRNTSLCVGAMITVAVG